MIFAERFGGKKVERKEVLSCETTGRFYRKVGVSGKHPYYRSRGPLTQCNVEVKESSSTMSRPLYGSH